MKKHQLKKLRKKMKFEWAKVLFIPRNKENLMLLCIISLGLYAFGTYLCGEARREALELGDMSTPNRIWNNDMNMSMINRKKGISPSH